MPSHTQLERGKGEKGELSQTAYVRPMKWKVLYAKRASKQPGTNTGQEMIIKKKQRQLNTMMTCSESKRETDRERDRKRASERARVNKLAKVSVVREATYLGH